MNDTMRRRTFIQAASGCAVCLANGASPAAARAEPPVIVSPGCRASKLKLVRIYMGKPEPHWPKPGLDLQGEVRGYKAQFEAMGDEFADTDFIADELVTDPARIASLDAALEGADGVIVIQLSIWTMDILAEILKRGKPTVLYAAPYSGHEWVRYGELMRSEEGRLLECLLTSDVRAIAEGVRPVRAIHHMRHAKILNVTARDLPADYVNGVREKFGTEIVKLERQRVLDAFEAVPEREAREECARWINGALEVLEPSEEEIYRSCRLALAFERLLDEENATVITADCYGTMYRRLPAFPCIGFTRLNDMGLGGICESDLNSAMTHILLQSLTGKPGFISDPTMDVSKNSAILAHCLGSTRMDGPAGGRAPYKIRSIMERQEGAVTQVFMRVGQRVTQAQLIGTDRLLWFAGTVIDAPDTDRGCRTKIAVQLDGDAETLWKNWSNGLHRVTCYGDIAKDLQRFCRFTDVEMIQEA